MDVACEESVQNHNFVAQRWTQKKMDHEASKSPLSCRTFKLMALIFNRHRTLYRSWPLLLPGGENLAS
jgi:hypothetical protein